MYKEKRAELLTKANEALKNGNVDEAEKLTKEIEELDASHKKECEARANLAALSGVKHTPISNVSLESLSGTGYSPASSFAGEVIDKIGNTSKKSDIYASEEYQDAFMAFVSQGEKIPAKFYNADQKTMTTDSKAVIPTTLMREIIKELKTYGEIYAKVRKLNVEGGVEFPMLSLKPTATWVGEGASETQKLQANDKIIFSYYGLECKLAQTLLANVVSIEEFNQMFVPLAVEAVVKALETAIISGDGNGKPLGIINDTRIPATNIIELNDADVSNWSAWKKKVFAKMKKSYRKGEFIMAQGTFDSNVDGMVDSNGQPIGRINYGINGEESYRFGGKNIVTVEDEILPPFESAAAGEVFAIFADLSNYAINSNMQMTTVKWIDNDTNEIKNKVILICDGKLLDANGVLLLKRKTS